MNASKSYYEYTPSADFLVTDEDAADFLQSQFTNELRPFATGQCTYGLWLDVKGKVIADSVVLCEGDASFRVLSERCEGERIASHMARHIIADDVDIEHRAPGFGFEVSSAGVRACGFELPERGRFVRIEDGLLYSVRKDVYHMVVDSTATRDALRRRLGAAGGAVAPEAARGLARMASGIPLVPDEIGATDLPGEGELEADAISFTKGCYLGQEVVARMHNIGKPQRRLFVVSGTGSVPAVPLALYDRNEKQVGELRSAYPKASGWSGGALLKTRFADTGSRLCHGDLQLSVIRPLREGVEND